MRHQRWLATALALAWMAQPARAQAPAQADARAATQRQAAPAYGPVLYVNGKPVTDTAHRDPAEVHDEADTGANPAAQPAQPQTQQQNQKRQATRRRPAWQPANEAMAPRPLHGEQGTVAQGVPIPPPVAAPQPVVPSSTVINGCQGSACMDASGRTYNGIGNNGNAGVNSNGRLCTRTGTTVQCF